MTCSGPNHFETIKCNFSLLMNARLTENTFKSWCNFEWKSIYKVDVRFSHNCAAVIYCASLMNRCASLPSYGTGKRTGTIRYRARSARDKTETNRA